MPAQSNIDSVKEQGRDPSVTSVTGPLPFSRELTLAGILLVLVSGFALVFLRHTAWLILNTWSDSRTFSHGFLIVPIFLYLVWIRRERLVALHPRPAYWMLPILGVMAVAWLVGSLGEVRVVQEFALVAMLDAIVWIVCGTAVVRALWFPLLFLFFAVPFGESAIGPLQDFTAHFAVGCLRLSHVPVFLENRVISVPSGPWVVAEACSGIRYLISSLVLGLVYASLVYRSKRRRVFFVLASIAVPIVANGLRAYGIILLAYLTDNRLAAGVDHIIYGWVFFTVVQLLLFSVGLRWREVPGRGVAESRSPRPVPVSVSALAAAAACAVFIIGSAVGAEAYLWNRAGGNAPQPVLAVSAPWRAVVPETNAWAPSLHPSSELSGAYDSGGHTVDVYVARYSGRKGVELVSGYNQFADPHKWEEGTGGFRTVVINGRSATVRWDVIDSFGASRLVWRWYCIGDEPTADATKVKLAQTEARLQGRPTAIAVVAISAGFLREPSEAASELQDLLNHTSLTLQPSE